MESETAVGHPDDDETCPNCGACKHCGHGGRPQFVPMPYPVYPPVVAPYRPYTQPWPRPYTGPMWVSTPAASGITPAASGITPNQISGTGLQTWNTAAGNYQH